MSPQVRVLELFLPRNTLVPLLETEGYFYIEDDLGDELDLKLLYEQTRCHPCHALPTALTFTSIQRP